MLRMLTLLAAMVGGVMMVSPGTARGSDGTKAATEGASAAQAPAVVVVFGKGEQVFDVGPLPTLGKKAKKAAKKSQKKSRRKKGAESEDDKSKYAYRGTWLEGYRAGFRCKVFLLFWAYVHRWDCSPVVAKDQVVLRPTSNYQEKKLGALKKAIGEQYKLSDHKLGWWALNGRWVVGGVFVLLILGGMIRRRRYRKGY